MFALTIAKVQQTRSKHILCKHTHDVSTKYLGTLAQFSVQVSFALSLLVDFG